jgi:23S rRNA (cytidine1920-2'-O)/16S rRNA (cytidine1409-2'-O)-methyltransferase
MRSEYGHLQKNAPRSNFSGQRSGRYPLPRRRPDPPRRSERGRPAGAEAWGADRARRAPHGRPARLSLRLARGLKLAAALDAFGLDPKGLIALDIGASTGGFTEVLLARGAGRVFAVDVGRDQLHGKLREDQRVVVLEGTDARALDAEIIGDPVGAIVADVSFISLTKALPAALSLAAPSAWLVALVKPQFEAGREAVGKGGIVRDAEARARAVAQVRAFINASPGCTVFAEMPSPIPGGSGNEEVLIGASHGA